MAIKKYKVEVVRTDEYEIKIDDSIYTDEFIEQWSESFYQTEEGSRQEDFVKHLSESITKRGELNFLEGFGFVKQKYHSMEEDDFLVQYADNLKIVTEEEYAPGILVKIISHDVEYESEIFQNEK
nr:hypothetical protein [uncultured Flavobacterium sp.]